MSSPTPGSDPNYPQGSAPQGQPDWNAPQGPPQGYGAPTGLRAAPEGYGPPAGLRPARPAGYGGPAPAYSGGPDAATGQRPGMVTAAGIIGIVWGALGLLFGLLGLTVAFTPARRRLRLLVLISVAVPAALLWAGIQVIQGKSPRLLLLISYVAIGINVLTMIMGRDAGRVDLQRPAGLRRPRRRRLPAAQRAVQAVLRLAGHQLLDPAHAERPPCPDGGGRSVVRSGQPGRRSRCSRRTPTPSS